MGFYNVIRNLPSRDDHALADFNAPKEADSRALSRHILPTSATMLGVCMTVMSIGRLGPASEWRLVMDKLMAIDALVFLTSAVLSFMSMRSPRHSGSRESQGEVLFLAGLALLALGAVALAFVIR